MELHQLIQQFYIQIVSPGVKGVKIHWINGHYVASCQGMGYIRFTWVTWVAKENHEKQ